MNARVRDLAGKLWDYHQLHHEVSHADVIMVLCSYDLAVAERGAQLFLDGWAPLLIFSGGLGAITKHLWTVPEADQFAAIAVGKGVPRGKILIENRSTNTGENVLFTKQLLAERGMDPRKFMLVQKPYMERRAYATFMKVWPGKDLVVTSARVSLDEYVGRRLRFDRVHRFANQVRVGADVELDVVARGLDPVDLAGADEEDAAARLDDEAIGPRLGRLEVLDDGGEAAFEVAAVRAL